MPQKKFPDARVGMRLAALAALILSLNCAAKAADAQNIDLSAAVLVTPPRMTAPEKKAAEMLVEETQKRSQVRWSITESIPSTPSPSSVVYLGQRSALLTAFPALAPQLPPTANDSKPEGYHIITSPGLVIVAGNDARGVLFGAGRLLRLMGYTGERPPDHLGTVSVAPGLDVATAPAYPLRGFQLGYRPKPNAYPGWTPAMMEQYIRDLIIFGANAIEGIPPRSDDIADSPHFTLPPMQGLIEQSRIAQEYGIEFWVWYPALDTNYTDSPTAEANLNEWDGVLKQLPRLDALFVMPGADPGHPGPAKVFPFLKRVADMLHTSHPDAKLWMTPQNFPSAWMDEFFTILKAEPPWLEGVVYGPQERVPLEEMRARLPARYKMRLYPDITHSLDAQFPVPDWDYAYQATESREGPNPRPVDEAAIFHRVQPIVPYGFIIYSEGCNDDVNKFIWDGLGWDPNEPVIDILRDFSRTFIGAAPAEGFAQGLMALERNWRGPLISNEGVYTTLAQFQELEKNATPFMLENWRFQQALYRAYYDATDRARLIAETSQEGRAMDELRRAPIIGSLPAIAAAERALEPPEVAPAAQWRARVFELAEALFNSIHAKLSVERYRAVALIRGANLDLIDAPLNDAQWLNARFATIKAMASEPDRLRRIDETVHWTDPGPGGFYENLGDISPGAHPHLVGGLSYAEDPAFLHTPFVGIGGGPKAEAQLFDPTSMAHPEWGIRRISSSRYAQTLFEQPLEMFYDGLDKTAHYKLRVVYGVNYAATIRLVANGNLEIQHPTPKHLDPEPIEYDIPREATAGGTLRLSWTGQPGLGGTGRGVQVAEVWLMRANAASETATQLP